MDPLLRSPRIRQRNSQGWREIDAERKRELIAAIRSGGATRGPSHAELDLTDRCNVACYFCNQQDTRTRLQIPIERALRLIDELAEGGVRSVRLSGGGDPLFHKEIDRIFDRLAERGIVVDNLTTNAVALTDGIARRLIRSAAREVIVSLNAADAADYHRMMKVKPALYQQVLDNVGNLVALRSDAAHPNVVVQFLLDRENVHRLVEMYEIAVALAVDVCAVNLVLPIRLDRIDHDLLLTPADRDLARPHLLEVLRRDRDRKLLEVNFAIAGWNEMLEKCEREVGHSNRHPFPTAPSFRDENGGCFFGWYSTAITGNGNMSPCCLLLKPGRKPVGNILESSFAEQWNGPDYTLLRKEMRQVLLEGGRAKYDPSRFKILDNSCVEPHACWLKNMFFRGDETFYRELGEALDAERASAVDWRGNEEQRLMARRRLAERHPRLAPLVIRLLDWSRPLRHRLGRLARGREDAAPAANSR